MNHYLATYTIKDGEHNYLDRGILTAIDEQAAYNAALTHTHVLEQDDIDDEGFTTTTWGFGDGLTESNLLSVREITSEQYEALHDTQTALDLNAIHRGRAAV